MFESLRSRTVSVQQWLRVALSFSVTFAAALAVNVPANNEYDPLSLNHTSPRINNGLISGPQPHNVHIMGFRPATNQHEESVSLGGGSIISVRHVLTAAHLIRGFGNFQIGYGGTRLLQLRTVYPASALVHPGFVPASRHNDIAILALRSGVTFASAVARPIRWASSAADPAPGRVATVVGFGFTFNAEGFPSMQLRSAPLVVRAASACRTVSVSGTQFCAMPQQARNVCIGDGGAGLFVPDASGAPVLVSVVLGVYEVE